MHESDWFYEYTEALYFSISDWHAHCSLFNVRAPLGPCQGVTGWKSRLFPWSAQSLNITPVLYLSYQLFNHSNDQEQQQRDSGRSLPFYIWKCFPATHSKHMNLESELKGFQTCQTWKPSFQQGFFQRLDLNYTSVFGGQLNISPNKVYLQ